MIEKNYNNSQNLRQKEPFPVLFEEEVGKRIKTYRKLANMSQRDLGEKLNVSPQQIHKYENGTNEISFKKLCLIARYLDIPFDYLSDGAVFLLEEQQNCKININYNENKKHLRYLAEISRQVNNMKDETKEKVIEYIRSLS